jgi:hypothetical protein
MDDERTLASRRARKRGAWLLLVALGIPTPGCDDPERPANAVRDAAAEGGRPDRVDPDAAPRAAGPDGAGGTGGTPEDAAAPVEASAGDSAAPADAGIDAPVDVAPPPPPAPPLYAIASTVFLPETETTYVNLIESLDVAQIDYTKSVEFPGRAAIGTFGGWLYVSDGEAPEIARLSVSGPQPREVGRLSFANFGLETAAVDEWATTFVNEGKAYLFNADSGSHIVWNPASMQITGEIEAPDLVRKNLSLDGSTAVIRGDRLYRTFFWKDWKAYRTSTEQVLATYDVTTDTLVGTAPETRCPGLNNRVERDETGALYFSNWIYNVTETLVRDAPRSCALRILPGADGFDPGWVLPFAELTQMREAAGLSYLGNGKAFLAVFHHERVMIDAMTDPNELALSPNWRLWGVDLAQRTARPLEGIDWLVGGYSTVRLDGRTFVLVPGDELAKTSVYEITGGGRATLRFEARGFAYQFVKIR